MSATGLAEDSVQLVRRLLMEALEPGEFKVFYDGDPDQIPTFNLPCIVVEQLADETVGGSYATDDITDTVLIRVIYNKSDDWTGHIEPTDTTHTKVRRAIGARDAVTGTYLPNTIKGALRPELYGDRRIGSNMTVELGSQVRPDQEGAGYATTEGHITVQIQYSVDIDPSEAEN